MAIPSEAAATEAYRAALGRARSLLRSQANQAIQAIDRLPESRLFIPVCPGLNPVGNLALHLAGNLRTLVGRVAGGVPYDRDREREFAARDVPSADVRSELVAAVELAERVVQDFETRPDRFLDPAEDPAFEGESRGDHLVRSLVHFAWHAGQIVQQAKIHTTMAQLGTAGSP